MLTRHAILRNSSLFDKRCYIVDKTVESEFSIVTLNAIVNKEDVAVETHCLELYGIGKSI